MQKNNIPQWQREMWRTKFAQDFQNTSFSDKIANNIAQWLWQYVGKYNDTILVNEAIKHAILQSQWSPL
jgi:hypothetical protein